MDINKQVILLTGASSGIGYDTAVALAKQGHKVYAAARRVERMEPLREWGVVPLRMDVTDEGSMRQGVQTLLDREGRIGLLSSTMVFFHWLLPARWWDSIVRLMGKSKWM